MHLSVLFIVIGASYIKDLAICVSLSHSDIGIMLKNGYVVCSIGSKYTVTEYYQFNKNYPTPDWKFRLVKLWRQDPFLAVDHMPRRCIGTWRAEKPPLYIRSCYFLAVFLLLIWVLHFILYKLQAKGSVKNDASFRRVVADKTRKN